MSEPHKQSSKDESSPKGELFWDLVRVLGEGTISDSQRSELETLLVSDPGLRKQFVEYRSLDAELQWWYRTEDAEKPSTPVPILDLSSSLSDPLIPDPSQGSVTSAGPISRWIPLLVTTPTGLFLMAILLFAVGYLGFSFWRTNGLPDVKDGQPVAKSLPSVAPPVGMNSFPENAVVGRLDRLESHVIIERDGTKQNAVEGMAIFTADSLDVPVDGGAELTLSDRSQAKLGPRTMMAFASPREVMLREGFVQIDARNRRSDAPLAINTPDAKTQIREAWLSMGAGRKRTQIRVAEGRVLASRRSDGLEVEIPEGYCSTIARAVDPGPRHSGNGEALFVVSTKALHVHEDWERFDRILAERIVGDRLWRSAVPVRVRTYNELQAEDLERCSLVVLSIFPEKVGVEQKLADLKLAELPIPIVCLEPIGFPLLGLTGTIKNEDFGFAKGPLVVDVAAPGHPLAGGFVGDGLKLFTSKKSPYAWGKPAEDALTIVRHHKYPQRWLLFGYDRGDSMVKGIAPARRVGVFMDPVGADYDAPTLDLIDAAIDWCLDSVSANELAGYY